MKTTKKRYNLFVKKVYEFMDVFGLKSWDLTLQLADLGTSTIARTNFDLGNRWASIKLDLILPDDFTDDDISKTAFHEVCELFFADFRIYMDRHANMVDQIIHEKIRTLENILYE